jgi:hypothetical protein
VTLWPDVTIDPAVVDAAVFAHQALPIHADEQPVHAADQLFVEYAAVLNQLSTPEWQMIYGVRGAGKTHLLKVYQERSRRMAIDRQVITRTLSSLPVYLDAQDFRSVDRAHDAEDRARASFRLFLGRLGQELISAVTNLDGQQALYATLTGRSRKGRAEKARMVVRDILSAVDKPPHTYPYVGAERTVEERDVTASTQQRKSRVAADLRLSRGQAGVGATGERTHEGSTAHEAETTSVLHGTSEPHWPEIRRLIQDLCVELGIERIDILIDNWTALDPDGNSLIQPYFAELLRLSFSPSDQISVKIGSDGLSTRLWSIKDKYGLNRQALGPDINLNVPMLEEQRLIEFFEWILFRRMLKNASELRRFLDPDRAGAPLSPAFITSMFDNRATFELLVRGTEGSPRLFLHCIRELAHITGYSVRERWDQDLVLRILGDRDQGKAEDIAEMSRGLRMLMVKIRPAVITRDEPVFALTPEQVLEHTPDLEELVSKRLIVDYSATRPDVSSSLRAFRVSDMLMREWQRARTFEQEFQVLLQNRDPREPGLPSPLSDLLIELGDEPDEASSEGQVT